MSDSHADADTVSIMCTSAAPLLLLHSQTSSSIGTHSESAAAISKAIAIPSFRDRRLSPEKAIERRRKKTERQREWRKQRKIQKQQHDSPFDSSGSPSSSSSSSSSKTSSSSPLHPLPSESLSSPLCFASESVCDEMTIAAEGKVSQSDSKSSNSSTEIQSLTDSSPPLSAALSISDLIIPLHCFDIQATKLGLREWYYQHASLSVDLIRMLLRNTSAYSLPALSSTLSLHSGFRTPSIDDLSNDEIAIVFEYACLKCKLNPTVSKGTALTYLANVIALLTFIGGVYHFRCGCLGLGNSTQCIARHFSGQCDWKAVLGGCGELTIDHNPARKKDKYSAWLVCTSSGPSSAFTLKSRISSWWWSTKAKSHPFRCNTCNTYNRSGKKTSNSDSGSEYVEDEDEDEEEQEDDE